MVLKKLVYKSCKYACLKGLACWVHSTERQRERWGDDGMGVVN